MKETSRRQQEILSFIREYIAENGISPTLEEIADAFSFSPAAAHYAIDALIKKGALEKSEGKNRTLKLTEAERDYRENTEIPLFPLEPLPHELAEKATDSKFLVPRIMAKGDAYAFRVRSESMRDAGIIPGDIAILTSDTSAIRNGDIVLADSGEGSERMELRRYRKLPGYVLLIPDNAIMGIRKSNSVKVYGILIAIRRDYGLPSARS